MLRLIRLITLLCLVLTGCVKTIIELDDYQADVTDLASLNDKKIILQVIDKTGSQTLGRQFMFLIFPFGRVHTDTPDLHVFKEFYTQLSLAGYHPLNIIDTSTAKVDSKILVELNTLSLNAYDLLITRRLSSHIDLTCHHLGPKTAVAQHLRSTESAFKSFGFKQQLDFLMKTNLKKTVKDCLDSIL